MTRSEPARYECCLSQVRRRCLAGQMNPLAASSASHSLAECVVGTRFGRAVKAFAAANDIPILGLRKPDRSRWDDRKLDHVLADMLNVPPKSTAMSTTGRRSASA